MLPADNEVRKSLGLFLGICILETLQSELGLCRAPCQAVPASWLSGFRISPVALYRFRFNKALALDVRTVQAACWVRFDCPMMFDFPVPSLKTMVTANSIS